MSVGDLYCWLWAAVPSRPDGALDVPRAAKAFGVSVSTLRRMLAADEVRPQIRRRAMQLAILRSRGRLLWPPPQASDLIRSQAVGEQALRTLASAPEEATDVLVVHFPRARVYSLNLAGSTKSLQRLLRAGGVVVRRYRCSSPVAAQLLQLQLLEHVAEHRCVVPTSLVPSGRTMVWRDAGGIPRRRHSDIPAASQRSARRAT